MNVIGLDIGGANLKAADGLGRAEQVSFALWKTPERLSHQVASLLSWFPPAEAIALTMTGELCDCFASKSEGVLHIVRSVLDVVPRTPVRVWTVDGEFATPERLAQAPLKAAAANWLALATFAGQFVPQGPGLLIDLGSTTCDLIPLCSGVPQPTGQSDPARLKSDELVYCGVRRTPLCAVFGLTKAAEWFATTADAFVVLGDLPEDPAIVDTADGRPLTKAHAQARLARMECDEDWPLSRTMHFAEDVRRRVAERIAESAAKIVARRFTDPLAGVVMAGAGEFLIPKILDLAGIDSPRISLAASLGPRASTAACAHAVATLARQR